MPKLFISYSRDDKPFAVHLIELLRRVYGMANVWYDDQIPGGTSWFETILAEIAKCDVFVYLISNTSIESKNCQNELSEATRLEKPIVNIKVRLDTILTEDLKRIQFVDMGHGVDADNFARAIEAINRVLHEEPLADRFFKRRDTWSLSLGDRLHNATRTLDILGYSLTSIAITHQGILRELLSRGVRIRVIISDPDDESLQAAIAKTILEVETVKQHARNVQSAKENFLLVHTSQPELFQIRITNFLAPFSYLGIDVSEQHGAIYCELYLRKVALSRNPMWLLKTNTDIYWSTAFREQFDRYWNAAKEVNDE